MPGGGAGHLADMNQRIKQNAALRKNRVRKARSQWQRYLLKHDLQYKQATPELLAVLRTKLKSERKNRRRRKRLYFLATVLIMAWLLAFVLDRMGAML